MKRCSHTVAWLLTMTAPQACADAWLYISNDMPGEATSPGHEDWIDILGYEVGGVLTVGEAGVFGITKKIDLATPLLFEALTNGQIHNNVLVDIPNPVNGVVLCRMELDGLVISSLNHPGTPADVENVKLQYSHLTYTYYYGKEKVQSVIELDPNGTDDGGPGPDTDEDGMPDSWEEQNGLVVGVNDADGDLDGDGLSNRDEFLVGSDPNSGASFFQVEAEIDPAAPGSIKLKWNSKAGTSYHILWSPDLVTPFTNVANVVATGSPTVHTRPLAGNVGFYRIAVAP